MPIVTIQITREGTTPEQKAALIKGATDLLAGVLNDLAFGLVGFVRSYPQTTEGSMNVVGELLT